MKDLCSFVIPSYNSVAWLPAAVESARQQTCREIEIIVVDDCSTDATVQYTRWLLDNEPRAVVIRNDKNMGRSESRNVGNRAAKGKYIFVLDADDLAYPRRVELSLPKLEKSAYVHGGADCIDAIGFNLGRIDTDVFNKDKALASLKNNIVHSTVAFHNDFAARYPHASGEAADLGVDDWTVQISAAFDGVRFGFIPHQIGAYRLLNAGVTATRDPAKVEAFKKRYLEALAVKT